MVLSLFLCELEEDRDFLPAFERLLLVDLSPEVAPLMSVVEFILAELSPEVPDELPMPEVLDDPPEPPDELLEVPVEVSVEVLLPFWAVRLGTEQHEAFKSVPVLGLVWLVLSAAPAERLALRLAAKRE